MRYTSRINGTRCRLESGFGRGVRLLRLSRRAADRRTRAAANIVSVVRPFEDPAPPDMHDFDLVTFFDAYHDITYLGVDRAKMNKAFTMR